MTDLFPTAPRRRRRRARPGLEGRRPRPPAGLDRPPAPGARADPVLGVAERGRRTSSPRCGAFKLVITNGGRPELFDVEADPAERRNVVAEHPDLAKRLQAELKAWLATERRPIDGRND